MDRSKAALPRLILIVEDEFLIAMELAGSVRALGYAVVGPAPTVKAAEQLLDVHQPDAALLDVNLHGTTVTPLAQRLRDAGIPFALVTASVGLALENAELAAAPKLNKPCREEDLAQVLLHLLGPAVDEENPAQGNA